MKYIAITLLLISSLWSVELGWSDDYETSLTVAQKENKNLYVLITSSTCGWCKKFKNTTLQDEEVLKMLNEKYILVNIDRDIDDFPSWMNTKSVPRHYFVTAKGEEIFTFMGYWDSLDFKSFLGDVEKKIKLR
ncbi:MAG: thioredoxin family protein [Sulfurimonas sp.]|nr:thioredoxin family protein [Sulfurimonas sp.]MDD3834620.1 thioredoxin family protein [Sulfurimonas sp.]